MESTQIGNSLAVVEAVVTGPGGHIHLEAAAETRGITVEELEEALGAAPSY